MRRLPRAKSDRGQPARGIGFVVSTFDPLLDGTGANAHRRESLRLAERKPEAWEVAKSGGLSFTAEQKRACIIEAQARIRVGETVRHIAMLGHMPSKSLLWEWLHEPDYRDDTSAAYVAQLEHFREELPAIAEDGRNDWMEIENERTGGTRVVLDKEHVQRTKLRIETRQWLMGKLNRQKYGDRTAVDLNAVVQLDADAATQRAGALLGRMEALAAAMPLIGSKAQGNK